MFTSDQRYHESFPPTMRLSEVVRLLYEPEGVPLLSERLMQGMRMIPKRYSESLGRPATVADLTRERAIEFLALNQRRGYAPESVRAICNLLRRLWRECGAPGLDESVSYQSVRPQPIVLREMPLPDLATMGEYVRRKNGRVPGGPKFRQRLAAEFDRRLAEATADALPRYFRTRFIPKRMHGKSPNTIQNYWEALRCFCRFLVIHRQGRDGALPLLGLDTITPVDVHHFYTWQLQRGDLKRTAERYRQMVLAILRHNDPARFPIERSKRAQQQPAAGTLRAYFRDHYLLVKDISAGTIEAYEDSLALLEHYAGGPVLLADLNDDLLGRFRKWIIDVRGCGRHTSNKHFRAIRAVWTQAWRDRLVDEQTRLLPLRVPKREPEAWTPQEFSRILAVANRLPGFYGDVPRKEFWNALLLTLYWSASRIGAVLCAPIEDLNPDRCTLRLRAEFQKHGRDEIFQLPPDLVELLLRVHRPQFPWLFPWPWDRTARHWPKITKHYSKILKLAGLPSGGKHLFHKIRRTSCTIIASRFGEQVASRHLGHSSVQVTRSYIDRSQLDATDVTKLLPAPAVVVEGGATC